MKICPIAQTCQSGSLSNGAKNNDPLKPLYLLVSTQRVHHVSLGGSTHVEGVDENPFEGLNPRLSIENTRGFRPQYAWIQPCVFLLTLDRESTDRCFLYACWESRLP